MKKIILIVSFLAFSLGGRQCFAQFDAAALVPYLIDLTATTKAQLGKDIASTASAAEDVVIAKQQLEGNSKFWKLADKAEKALKDLSTIKKDERVVVALLRLIETEKRVIRAWIRIKSSYREDGLSRSQIRAMRNLLYQTSSLLSQSNTIYQLLLSSELRTDQGTRLQMVDNLVKDIDKANSTLGALNRYLDKQDRRARGYKQLAEALNTIDQI
ncbi:hypothetical protein [Xanthovirga aplysinae]|uniref:hypothetical protein n=1 Tax=Xanthovirga aplysinae TaxID=2529853 RepID=UPI0012BB53D7|nr:hypothetical protein [Xanthovirga aplysinae]MTI33300.1 hypothetical protein [Xanthovirga aplysinae]